MHSIETGIVEAVTPSYGPLMSVIEIQNKAGF